MRCGFIQMNCRLRVWVGDFSERTTVLVGGCGGRGWHPSTIEIEFGGRHGINAHDRAASAGGKGASDVGAGALSGLSELSGRFPRPRTAGDEPRERGGPPLAQDLRRPET